MRARIFCAKDIERSYAKRILGGASANVCRPEDEINMYKIMEKIATLKGQCASLQVENNVYKDTRKQNERNTAREEYRVWALVQHPKL